MYDPDIGVWTRVLRSNIGIVFINSFRTRTGSIRISGTGRESFTGEVEIEQMFLMAQVYLVGYLI